MQSTTIDLASVRNDIRAVGLRATPAQTATLILLRKSASRSTHADVAGHLTKIGADKITAFRDLNVTADAGLLRRTERGDHVWRFESIDTTHAEGSGHFHFLCVDCGTVTRLRDVHLTADGQRQSKNVSEVTEILLRGHCNDCR